MSIYFTAEDSLPPFMIWTITIVHTYQFLLNRGQKLPLWEKVTTENLIFNLRDTCTYCLQPHSTA